jgi:tyrosinase
MAATSTNDGLRVRRSITDLLVDHDQGNTAPLDTLIRAWDGIQKLPPDDYNSFYTIAGYHAQPYRGAGWGNAAWWGGYCHHGNVLFPTWHRAYVLRLENALRSIPDCQDVTMPYWNEVGVETLRYGVPTIFLDAEYTFADGTTIKNPLQSYFFQKAIFDNLSPIPDADYSKPAGYETVRYPFSGLVGPNDIEKTEAYNASLAAKGKAATDKMLNDNVKSWLNSSIKNSDGQTILTHTSWKYRHCLRADNYTVFSNLTSATQWNEDEYAVRNWTPSQDTIDKDHEPVVPLENPHNDIHLAVGGFNLPGLRNVDSADAADANGDIAENDTAAFDPLFFFHHCFIDKVFWTWQQIKGCTKELEIIDKYPGTNSGDSQGPTPGVPGNTWLTLKTPLDPFTDKNGTLITSEVSNMV